MPGTRNGTELVTGATGYVGARLVERLHSEGRKVRALVRDPSRLEASPEVEVVKGDMLTGEGLAEALDGCSVAYYLVHSMEPCDDDGGFASRDRDAAARFAEAAVAAGMPRAVYLGGMVPESGPRSDHLASRLEVEEILLEALPESTAFRASITIGSGSSSFRLLVRLVERLWVLPFPAWRDNRTRPIDERDAIEYLARAAHTPGSAGRSLDIAGPDVVSYGEMVERIAFHLGVRRTSLRLPVTQMPAASAIVAGITGQPRELVRPLMESLETDLLPRDDAAHELFGFRLHRFDGAVERALREWERVEELAAR
ncbi:MAG TPA: NAD(P)H-binding protein [Thermoleophilaceae bacterium]|nr:NAD(P)H-binding protein [Thermoleophilaceae bacterium]